MMSAGDSCSKRGLRMVRCDGNPASPAFPPLPWCHHSDMLENLVRKLELDGLWDALSSCLTVVSVLEVNWEIVCVYVFLVMRY